MTERFRDPNKLHFKGILQVETALGALAHTGLNPDAEGRLQNYLDIHALVHTGETDDDFELYLQDGAVVQAKADILTSLGVLAQAEHVPEYARTAAATLLEIL